jgi:hypothetical protein
MKAIDGKMLGPDVLMVYDMSLIGMKSICDLSVQCKHYDERRKVWLDAEIGKGYDIKYHKEEQSWKMTLSDITDGVDEEFHKKNTV